MKGYYQKILPRKTESTNPSFTLTPSSACSESTKGITTSWFIHISAQEADPCFPQELNWHMCRWVTRQNEERFSPKEFLCNCLLFHYPTGICVSGQGCCCGRGLLWLLHSCPWLNMPLFCCVSTDSLEASWSTSSFISLQHTQDPEGRHGSFGSPRNGSPRDGAASLAPI